MKLSVVMSVYNGEAELQRTLDSILAQTERDFELIVVDDGSTDATPSILARCTDSRLRVVAQQNQGLTRALIRGCSEAHGEFIARHDCGDVSHPERFAKQLAAFSDDVVLVSCWTKFVGPEDELLFVAKADGEEVRQSLSRASVDDIRGLTHHGSAMFRRDDYLAAGGYRAEFRFAQDLDLWLRIAKRGRVVVVGEVLYEARYSVGAISASRRREQIALAKIAIAMRDGADETESLAKARALSESAGEAKRDAAGALYFIASCLRRNGDMRYKQYARAALRRRPLHLRSWLLLMR